MKKFYVELGNSVRAAVTCNGSLVMFGEYLYNISTLNVLANIIKASAAETVTIIMHGILHTEKMDNSYVAYDVPINGESYYCNMNKTDVDAMLSVLDKLHIKDVKIVDKYGYYESLTSGDAIIVDKTKSLCLVYLKHGADRKLSYVASSELEAAILRLMAETNVTTVLIADKEFREDMKFVDNADKITANNLPRVLPALSLFEYADSDLSDRFKLNLYADDSTAAQNTDLPESSVDEIPDAKEVDTKPLDVDEDLLFYEDDELDQPSEAESSYYKQDTYSDSEITNTDETREENDDLEDLPGQNYEEDNFEDLPEQNYEEDKRLAEFEESQEVQAENSKLEESAVDIALQNPQSSKKKHSVLPASILLLSTIAATFAIYMRNDIVVRDNIYLANQIADCKTENELLTEQINNSKKLAAITLNSVSVYQSIMDLKINGYVGEFSVKGNSYELLVYLYKAKDKDTIIKELNDKFNVTDVEERGTLAVDGTKLYKYRVSISEE